MDCLMRNAAARLFLTATIASLPYGLLLAPVHADEPAREAESGPLLRFVAEPPESPAKDDAAPAKSPVEQKQQLPSSNADAEVTSDAGNAATSAPGDSRSDESASADQPPPTTVNAPAVRSSRSQHSLPRAGSAEAPAGTTDFDDVLNSAPSRSADTSPRSITPQQVALRDQVRRTLARYYRRPVNARDHSPWEVFHWVIAYNVDAQLYTRGPGGETANAIAWLCYNYPCAGQRLLALDRGRPTARYGVGLEGHPGQFLAILAQSRVMKDYPLRVDGRSFTVADLVETTKLNCNSKRELTFQLIALSHYLDLDETWKSRTGETWSVPRLIREEIASPIRGSACGGTHRLMGLTYCVRKRQQRGQPIDGEYLRAKTYIDDYVQFTLRMQNPDGSFSTEWFAGRGARPDVDRRIQTTGHILEWMVFAASEEQLEDPRIVKAVNYLSKTLLSDETRDWKIGPLGHALRSLSLYDRRVFKPLDERPAAEVARRERPAPRVATDPPEPPQLSRLPGREPASSEPAVGSEPATPRQAEKTESASPGPARKEPTGETGPLFIVPSLD